jgi:hypothetical protein
LILPWKQNLIESKPKTDTMSEKEIINWKRSRESLEIVAITIRRIAHQVMQETDGEVETLRKRQELAMRVLNGQDPRLWMDDVAALMMHRGSGEMAMPNIEKCIKEMWNRKSGIPSTKLAESPGENQTKTSPKTKKR